MKYRFVYKGRKMVPVLEIQEIGYLEDRYGLDTGPKYARWRQATPAEAERLLIRVESENRG